MAMTSLAVAADTWVQATVGESAEVMVAPVGSAGLIVFVGAAQPNSNSRFGATLTRNEREKFPIGESEQVWVRSAVEKVATTALVLPYPVAA